jgi:putative ATP-binding cassette transporter
MPGLNREVWRRFWAIARPFWVSEDRPAALGLLALLLVILLAQTGFSVLYVSQTGEFTSALAAQDAARFWRTIAECTAVLIVSVPVYSFYHYTRDKLAIRWRRWLTHRFLTAYLCDRVYYRLNVTGGIDNPDQRIAEDINAFTQQSLYFLMVALSALMQLVAFTGVLWSISKELVAVLIAYAIAGNLLTTGVFGRRLIALNFQQLRREADFRFGLVRIREHAEPIALHRGEGHELAQAKTYFAAAFTNFNRVIRAQLNLAFFQFGFSFMALILPTAIIATRVLAGELEVGRAVQAAGAFAAILSAMTIIVDHFGDLSKFAAGVERLDGFSHLLLEPRDPSGPNETTIESVQAMHLGLEDVTVQTPGRERTLVRNLTVTIPPGEGLMIVGESGAGKSSLLRAVAGLWNAGSGRIAHPRAAHLMFLPQQPYLVIGSLRNQLLYPGTEREVPDQELCELLERVNLPNLVEHCGGLDVERDWAKLLSVGEQQRLAFARVLLGAPRYVLLDEATSALDAANEHNLYEQLKAARTTPISVSHRPALLPYHHNVLLMARDGTWRLVTAEAYRAELGAVAFSSRPAPA